MNKTGATRWRLWPAMGSLTTLTLACSDGGTATGQPSEAELPEFETSAAALQQTYETATAKADEQLARLAALVDQAPETLEFTNTVHAFEEIIDKVALASMRAGLLKDVHPVPEVLGKASARDDTLVSVGVSGSDQRVAAGATGARSAGWAGRAVRPEAL